jgi:hypothetical protein
MVLSSYVRLPSPIRGGPNKNASLRRSWSVVWLALARGYGIGVQNYRRLSGRKSGIGIWSLISLPRLLPFGKKGDLDTAYQYEF